MAKQIEPDGLRVSSLAWICAAIAYGTTFIAVLSWIGETQWGLITNVVLLTLFLGTIASCVLFIVLINVFEEGMETSTSVKARAAVWRRVFAFKLHRDYMTGRPIWLEMAWVRNPLDGGVQWRKGR